MNEERDIKKEVTERWVEALDYFIFNKKVTNYKTFAKQADILYQRITEYRTYINSEGRASYVSMDHLVSMIEKFDVSEDYLLFGEGEKIKKRRKVVEPDTSLEINELNENNEYGVNQDKKKDNSADEISLRKEKFYSLELTVHKLLKRLGD